MKNNTTQIKIDFNDLNIVDDTVNVWDKDVKIEQNGYFWTGDPLYEKGNNYNSRKPVIVEFIFWMWWYFSRF